MYAGQQLHLTGNITSWFYGRSQPGRDDFTLADGARFEAGHADWLMVCLA